MPEASAGGARKRSRSLARDLVGELTQRILLGQLVPGDKLPSENEIVREQGVSRTVVREAISRLQASGLVETRHGIGTFVLERKVQTPLRLSSEVALGVRDILELRLGLETQAVALAARRRSAEQLEAMRQALDDFRDALFGGQGCEAADRRFHLLIAEATGNPYFKDVMLHFGTGFIPRSRFAPVERACIDLSHPGHMANLEHEAILAAIRRQDPDAARAAMWTHLCNSRERLAPDE